MKVKQLCEQLGWDLAIGDGEREITGGIYCCDLLSIVMGRAPESCLWITVIGNVNTMAVSTLADTACVVIAEAMPLDEEALEGAKKGNVTVLRTKLPVFKAAMAAAELLKMS